MFAIDADHLVGIDGQSGWFESTDGGVTWSNASIGVATRGVTMADADSGWLWTANTLYTVVGSDRQIEPTAYVLPPFEPTPGCTWQPEIRGQEGTSGRFLTWTTFLNTGAQPCPWPPITGATAISVLDGTEIDVRAGAEPLDQLNAPVPGGAVTITLWSPTTYQACEGEPPSVPVTDFRFEFGDVASPPLPLVLEGACGIGYTIEQLDAS